MSDQTPRRPVDAWDDAELAALFRDEPDLYDLSRSLKASRPDPVVGPHFEPYLRARLMDAAARELRPRGLSRWLRPRPALFAGGGAALGMAMIAAVVVATVMYQPHDTRIDQVSTNVAENHDVSPDDVIRVSFTESVDHSAVEQNLQIHPATAVQTHWEGTTLVITPLHRLAANTPYTVTIPKSAVRGSRGQVAQSDIRIAFGTKATPSPGPTQAPVQPPTLQVVALGPVAGGSAVVLAPNGVVATGALVTPPAPASPTPAATVLPTGLPSPLSSALPSASPSATPVAPQPALARLDPSGATTIGPAAAAAAFSPSGASIAFLVPHGAQADLWVAKADGSHAVRLVRNANAGSPLAWSGEDGVLYVAGASVDSVDLQGRSRPVGGGVRIAPGEDVALVPGGSEVYLGPLSATATPGASSTAAPSASPSPSASAAAGSDQGVLVDLGSGATRALHGIRHLPAFSADGSRVAWVDESGTAPVLEVSRTAADGSSASAVATAASGGDGLSGVALSGDGSRVVYTLTRARDGNDVRVVSVASGETVAVGDGQPVLSPSLSTAGDRIAFLRPLADGSLVAAEATVPGVAPVSPAPDAVPAAATSVIDGFVADQIAGDTAGLRALGAPALTVGPQLTPGGVTRSYVIKAALDPATGQVSAQVRLVKDASHDNPAAFADEGLLLQPGGDATPWLVSSAAITDFQSEPNGPQIVHVSSERQGTSLVVRLAFDSDLDPSTVTGRAITLTDASGAALAATVTYEVESRTAVVTLASAPAGTLTLAVSGALRDIAGQALPTGYSTSLQS